MNANEPREASTNPSREDLYRVLERHMGVHEVMVNAVDDLMELLEKGAG